MSNELTTGEARVNAYRHRVISYYMGGNDLDLNEAKNIGDNLAHCVNLYDELVEALENLPDPNDVGSDIRLGVDYRIAYHGIAAVLAKTKEMK